jgi:hypothetical protein
VLKDPGFLSRAALLGIPIATGFVSLIDPGAFVFLAGPSVALAVLGLVWARRAGASKTPHTIVLLLTSVFVLTAWSEPRWCCDATPYYMYVRSAAFDHDFDFANEWAAFGVHSPALTPTGRAINAHSIGPALLWTPFFLLAHLYVVVVNFAGLGSFGPTGYSAPYLLATAAGTGTVVVAGILALWQTSVQRFSPGAGTIAVALGLLTSTLPYYTFVVPSVAHGAVFAASALFLFVWVRVEKNPSLPGWLTLAALLGVVSLFRWQAVVLGLMFVPLFLDAWRRRIGRWWWGPLSVLVSAAVFSPQMAAWWILFGSPFAAPTKVHGMDWTSPHFVDVLFSADRGLFTWTPAMAIGCLGWVFLARAWPAFAGSAAAVFFATTWVNGGVAIWSGADAFGARRFDLLIPLWVMGFAALIESAARTVLRRPLIAPAAALALFALWNVGLIRLHRNGVFPDVAPFEEVAARQAASVRRASENWLGWIAGPRGRNFAYRAFVGRYFYLNTGFDGRIDLTLPNPRFLSGGWSERVEQPELGAFRFAPRSGACVKLPLQDPFDLPVSVTARSLVEEQLMTLSANGQRVGGQSLPMDWAEVRFNVPAALLNPGENLLCLAFSQTRRNERAAAVRLIQLP